MSHSYTDRNLLIGILAHQMDFVGHEQLVDAMHAWVRDKSRSLDDFLVESKAIDERTRELVLALVDRHLELHHSDPQQSLASLSSVDHSLRNELESISDEDVSNSLSYLTRTDPGEIVGSDSGNELFSHTTMLVDDQSDTRYRILRPHAKGGLGQVSVALDKELNREVALKEIQATHADRPESRTRFMMEAEITGGLEHPGIVPVYGLGTYSDGRPFYAMRFVRGDSLKEATDRFHESRESIDRMGFQSVEFRKLLGRFVDVCNAIEYAHSRGVLHRDLKPGNIMLGKYGETLVVDWGLSKVVGREEREVPSDEPAIRLSSGSHSAPTQMGSAIGTPQFMSPEQASGRIDQLGPASDVYSLGATMYYLLSGRAPFKQRKLEKLLRAVEKGDSLPLSSHNTHIPAPLVAVCEKAMAVEFDERYASPSLLADDVERWLADEPVSAFREPLAAQVGRWVRKHQTKVVALSAVVLVGLISLFVILAIVAKNNQQLSRLNTRLDETNQDLTNANQKLTQSNLAEREARLDAERSQQEAELASEQLAEANLALIQKETEARRERDIAVAINDFLREDLLGRASPKEEPDRDIMLRTALDRAANSVGQRFTARPLVWASIAQTIGNTYHDLGIYEQAEEHLTNARDLRLERLGEGDPATLATMSDLGVLYLSQARFDDASELLNEVLETSRESLGDDHPETMTASTLIAKVLTGKGQYQEAVTLYESTLAKQVELLGDRHSDSLVTMNNLAGVYERQGRYVDAERLYRITTERLPVVLGEDHPNTMITFANLAGTLNALGRYVEAVPIYERTIAIQQRVLGEDHPTTLATQSNLASLYNLIGRFNESEELFTETIDRMRSVLGERHPTTLATKNNLAMAYQSQERLESAETLFRESLHDHQEELGSDHPHTLAVRSNLANILDQRGRFQEAIELYEQTLDDMKRTLGEEHPNTLSCMNNLALACEHFGRFDRAVTLYQESLEISRRDLGADHPNTIGTVNNLALVLEIQGRMLEAGELFREAWQHARNKLGPADPRTINVTSNLARHLERTGQLDEADLIWVEIVEIEREAHPESVMLATALESYAVNLLNMGRAAEAEAAFRECLDIRITEIGDHWLRFSTESLLGLALANQSRFDEAEPLLTGAYDGLWERWDSVSANAYYRVYAAIQRNVSFYDAWHRLDQSIEYRVRWMILQRRLNKPIPFVTPVPGYQPPRPNPNS